MKKNLKKVISAVISLAIAGGLVPASLAAKVTLTDVADTASYATAVNTLVALNVINGYEDGTFLPDNLITRAEVTKVVVAALNMLDSAEGMSGSTQFTDMDESSAWANGYVNAGVQQGFINGMGDGTFAPKANVTYAQIVKMLVSSLGYDEYAEFMGGYPNGYLQIANSEGVTNGVKASANDNVTRAQVAQLVYNFLKTPIVEKTGMEYSSNGQLVPTLAKMDGKNGNDYKTILTQNFDAYFVEGYVTDTHKSSEGLDADQIAFGIAKSELYDNSYFRLPDDKTSVSDSFDNFKEGKAGSLLSTVYVGDTDAADYLGVYATAIIMVDEYDDYRLISFEPSGKNKTVKFDASLLDTDDYEEDSDGNYTISEVPSYLKFFATESASKSTKYNLKDVKLYVNGYEVKDNKVANFQKYVINNTVGEIELVDTYKTDGYYDAIYVSYYETAQVDTVMTSSKKIMFNKYTKGASSSLTLDEDANDKLVYNIYYNGEKITLAELKKDDILSIAFDINSGFKSSNVYDIYVSRNVQSGKLTGRNESDEIVTIGGTQYKFVETFPLADDMKLSDEFTIYVDYFGRIFAYETDTVNAKYALIDKLTWSSAEENYRATIFTVDGTTKTYTLDASKATVTKIDGTKSASKTEAMKYAFESVYNSTYSSQKNGTNDEKWPANKRVIKYKISSSTGNMTEIMFMRDNIDSYTTVGAEKVPSSYKERTKAIGSVKLSDATKVIDAITYCELDEDDNVTYNISDLSIATVDSLVDDTPYGAYAYGDKLSDGTYPLVLVISGEGKYNASSRFAVVTGAPESSVDEAGDSIYTIPAFYKGEETSIIANDEMEEDAMALNKGDVFMFVTDGKGYAKQIDVIFNFTDAEAVSQKDLAENAIVNENYDIGNTTFVKYPTGTSKDYDQDWNSSLAEPIQIVFGPVIDKGNSYFSIGQVRSGTFTEPSSKPDEEPKTYTGLYTDKDNEVEDGDGLFEISTTDSTVVYTYDYSKSSSGTNRFEIGRASSIVKSVFGSANTFDTADKKFGNSNGNIILWDVEEEVKVNDKTEIVKPNHQSANFALALVVDGTAVDVFTFIADN